MLTAGDYENTSTEIITAVNKTLNSFQVVRILFMSIKQKFLNVILAHPKPPAVGLGLALTLSIATAIGLVDNQQLALAFTDTHHHCLAASENC
ncbi:MAG TPA: hypothetical protein VE089_08130 [Nitrososphaeraceae archaeon]|nr:hypothetical protein [Nitrososphaeraceae archaeon]